MDLLHAADGMEIWLKFLDQSRRGQKYMCLFVFSSFEYVVWTCVVAGVEAIYAADSMSYVYMFFILQVSLLRTLRSLKHRLAAGEC